MWSQQVGKALWKKIDFALHPLGPVYSVSSVLSLFGPDPFNQQLSLFPSLHHSFPRIRSSHDQTHSFFSLLTRFSPALYHFSSLIRLLLVLSNPKLSYYSRSPTAMSTLSLYLVQISLNPTTTHPLPQHSPRKHEPELPLKSLSPSTSKTIFSPSPNPSHPYHAI